MPRVSESRTNQALVHNYFIARKYCVLSRYVANNSINVFPANTFFNDTYQTISDIQFIATGRVAKVTGYKTRYFTSSDSIVKSRRRVEIQSTSEMSPYFTMTKCNKLFITYLLAQLNAYQSSAEYFNHFNDGSYDYVIQKAVTKTIRMLSV